MKEFLILFCFLIIMCISVTAQIIHVPGDQPTIQAGINAAQNGDTVLVAEGTYYENVLIENKAVTLASRFLIDDSTSHISKTIINGSQPVNTDNGSVIMIWDTPELNTICGFTLTGGTGRKKVFPGGVYSQIGGGIDIDESSAIIKNNHIINNSVINLGQARGILGGGISCGTGVVSGLILEISGNLISGNEISGTQTGGGGIAYSNYIVGGELDFLIEDNIIENNTVINTDTWKAMGGGIFLDFCLPTIGNQTIRNNIIRNNNVICPHSFGGGLYFIIRDTVNSGTVDNEPGPYVYNNIISGNHSDYLGGGVSVWRADFYPGIPTTPLQSAGNYVSKPSFINNTIVNNTAQDGSGLFIMNHIPFLMNNILWNDYPVSAEWGEIYLGNEPYWLTYVEPNTYGGAEMFYNDVQGGWDPDSGEGNIDFDPIFEDPLISDYHLQDTSPCIQTAIDTIEIAGVMYFCPPYDIEGYPRPYPVGTMPDMGAYEYQILVGIEENLSSIVPNAYSLSQNFPNPFNPSTTIEFALPTPGFVTLSVYNILGEKVATLVSENLTAGSFKYEWDATELTSGIYFYRIQAGSFVETKKMVLLK